jgi:UDP-GlcNAc:undecaprenyl-phosphate GlcNAc-1-phosphate transferase
MDGLDGLAGGKGFLVLAWLLVAAIVASSTEFIGPLVTMLGVIGGFLVYNLRHPMRARASVFLGDSGSMALGLTLGWYCIHAAAGHDSLVQPISVAWLLALPIMDTCGQFARRVSQGRHPFDADHDHFHHHFIYAGIPVSKATALILGLSIIAGLIGVGGLWLGLPEAMLTYPWIAWLFAHIYLSMRPHRFRRIVAKLNRNNQKARYE